MSRKALRYGSAGVDLESADDAKQRLKRLVESTFTAGSVGGFGGFGGMFRVPDGYREPVLVSSADGVGTKVKVAIEAGKHDTIGARRRAGRLRSRPRLPRERLRAQWRRDRGNARSLHAA